MNLNELPEDPFALSAANWRARHQKSGNFPRIDSLQGVILGYQMTLGDYAKRKRFKIQPKSFPGDFYVNSYSTGSVGLAVNFGIGAPASVALMEILVAFEVKKIISIGLAGGIQSHLQPGDLVVCHRAIRNEGTSRHYRKPSRYAYSSKALTERLCQHLGETPYLIATSWTTDAPFRELHSEVERMQRGGVACVEMEAAALFAAGQALNIPVAAAFSISDNLLAPWQESDPIDRLSNRGLERLVDAAILALTTR